MMRRFAANAWAIVLLILLWQVWVMTSDYNSIVVVSPVAVASELLHHPLDFLLPAFHTLAVAICGLALGLVAGLLLASVVWASPLLQAMTMPVVLLLTTTPVVCIIPILARIFGYELRSEVIAVIIMTFFPGYIYASAGMKRMPNRTREYFHTLNASGSRRFFLLALPSAYPDLATALRIGAGYSVLITIVAEFLMQAGGLGTLFAVMMQEFNLRRALGASVVSMMLSFSLYKASGWMEQKILQRFR